MTSKPARLPILAAVLPTLALVVGACSTPSGGGSSNPPGESSLQATILPAATATAVATDAEPSPSEIAVGGGQPTPGAIDPCSLLTSAEASTLMGKTLGAGVSATLDPDRVCTWKSGLTEVKLILAPPAPDTATATAYWDAERAQVPAGVTVTDLTFFDRSAYGSGAVSGLSISALFVIDGNHFFDLYCGFPACSQDASVTAATLITGRLP